MMKFAVGYQQHPGVEPFARVVAKYREHIDEVYFPWIGVPSGRAMLGSAFSLSLYGKPYNGKMTGEDLQRQLEQELQEIRSMGIKLDILFNANCFGEDAISVDFEKQLCAILEHLDSLGILPDIVTTTSPFAADRLKKHFPKIERRASVNMRIDSIPAMEYLADIFDSFHIRRDIQRDLPTVAAFHEWCRKNGRKLCMLANSGCLRYCPGQIFHDNMIAHDTKLSGKENAKDYTPHLCWKAFADPKNHIEFLKGAWIRPEDLHHYEPYFQVVKLATRVNAQPGRLIEAYVKRKFDGNLLNLMEPDLSRIFAPYIIDNSRFPENWFADCPANCAVTCTHCGKCEAVFEKVRVRKDL